MVVSWLLRITGTEELTESWSDLHVAVDGDVASDRLAAQRLENETLEVRLDRVGDGDTRVDLLNGGERDAVIDLPGSQVAVPAGAAARITPFAGCDRSACTVHARLDGPLDGGVLVTEGPVVATEIKGQPTFSDDAPVIRSEPVTRLMTVPPSDRARVVVDGNIASRVLTVSSEDSKQVAVRLRMHLVEGTAGSVVRYRPRAGTGAIVLSAAAGPGESQETVVDLRGRVLPIDLELISGDWGDAQVQVSAEAMVAYPDGVPDGATVSAKFKD